MSHTPSPWSYEHGTSDHYHIHAPNDLNIATTCDRFTLKHSAAAQSMEEDEANARLIAAAPELLAACERILSDPRFAIHGNETIRQVQAAVCRAHGEEEGGPL